MDLKALLCNLISPFRLLRNFALRSRCYFVRTESELSLVTTSICKMALQTVPAITMAAKPMAMQDKTTVDNFVFRLHTKVTTAIFIVSSIIVVARWLIGPPIMCHIDKVHPAHIFMINGYCWIHSTFTLPERIVLPPEEAGVTAHPGVGVPTDDEPQTYHKYYQWVAFALFLQALMFHAPRALWVRRWEGNKIRKFVPMPMVENPHDYRMPFWTKPAGVVPKAALEEHIKTMVGIFFFYRGAKDKKSSFRKYFLYFIICEVLLLLNNIFQLIFIDIFLGGTFTSFGVSIVELSNADPEDRSDPMNLVFPKVTKCTFRQMGASGTIEQYDGICVLPINIINEKIYIFLWFWLIMLLVATIIQLGWRLISLCSSGARKSRIRLRANGLVEASVVSRVVDRIGRGEWFFLQQVAQNLDPFVFAQFLTALDAALTAKTAGSQSQHHIEKAEKGE